MAETTTADKPKTTSRKGPATIGRAYITAISNHDLDAAEALWKPGSVDHLVGMTDIKVPGDFRSWFGNLFKAMPDFSLEILTVTAQKERAAVHSIARGTFNGTAKFEGLSPNGAKVELAILDLITIKDGKIVENHGFLNGAEMARQLGALPPQGSFAEKATTGALNAKVAAAKLIERARNSR